MLRRQVQHTSGPAGLAVAETDLSAARAFLNTLFSLTHVIEVSVGGIVDLLALPVSEAIGQARQILALPQHEGQGANVQVVDLGVGDDTVVRAVGELVPAVHRSDSHLGELIHHLDDSLLELGRGEASAVEDLGTDGDTLDDVLVTVDVLLQDVEVLVEGVIIVGPADTVSIWPGNLMLNNQESPTKLPKPPGISCSWRPE